MIISHNLLAMNAQRQLNIVTTGKKKETEKLSSGYRINRAADDAAGLQISEKLRTQIRGLHQGRLNDEDGLSWLNIADGAMAEVHDMIHRIKELSVQASNGTYTDQDREAIDNEIRQLKKDINRIGTSTEFNTMKVFDNGAISMEVDGTPEDLTVFDATYDKATGDVTFGGFLFNGERISWNAIDPAMVTIDPNTGKQVFSEGDYSYRTASGTEFHVSCKGGDEVPVLTRKIKIGATQAGMTIDGELISWTHVKDEDGISLSEKTLHSATWSVDYKGAKLGFFFGDTLQCMDDVIRALNNINDGSVSYTWTTQYSGNQNEQAVDINHVGDLRISAGAVANAWDNAGRTFGYTLRAGNGEGGTFDGLWLEDINHNAIAGSEKSWADLGITSWDSGSDIRQNFDYIYSDDEGTNDTYVEFHFQLSDITSKDSVIDGLDGVRITGDRITTSYSTTGTVSDPHVASYTVRASNGITFAEEVAFGRDLDQQTVTGVAADSVNCDIAAGTAQLELKDAGANPVITYSGNVNPIEQKMENDLDRYIDYLINKKTVIALAGGDPQAVDLVPRTLDQLVGAGNITTSGYFDGSVTIDTANMTLTDGAPGFAPGQNGRTYPTAFVDFGGLGTNYTLAQLANTGFNSTCRTCDKHYSIQFVESLSGTVQTSATNGYRYQKQDQPGENYLLQIDISSLASSLTGPVSSGGDLAKALVEVASECFDFHYTQYAAQGSRLYVYDNRDNSSSPVTRATFDTEPYNYVALNKGNYSLGLRDATGRSVNVGYEYDFGDAKDHVLVNMVADGAGGYMRAHDGSYVAYDPLQDTDPANPIQRYRVDVSYTKADNSAAANRSEMKSSYAKNAVENMINSTNIAINATNYSYADMGGNEKPNVAVRAIFNSKIEQTTYDNGLYIQNSGRPDDWTRIPRFALNTAVMKLFGVGTKTLSQARYSMDAVDYALDFISDKRSMYGAYYNRIEHTAANNSNIEENTQAAESRIRDTNMAEYAMKFAKSTILEQAGQAMLAQANQSKQGVLTLLG